MSFLSEICLILLIKYAEYVGVCFCNTMTQALEYYEKSKRNCVIVVLMNVAFNWSGVCA